MILEAKPKMPSTRPHLGYVYLMKHEIDGLYKIGRSTNPHKRLSSINTVSPYRITLQDSFQVRNNYWAEAWIHEYLRDYRVRGEWFKLPSLELWKEAVRKVWEFPHVNGSCFPVLKATGKHLPLPKILTGCAE